MSSRVFSIVTIALLATACGSDDSSGGSSATGGAAGSSGSGGLGGGSGGSSGSGGVAGGGGSGATGGSSGAAGGGGTAGSSGAGGSSGSGGAAGGGGAAGNGGNPTCNSTIGVTQPLPVCSQQSPCTNLPPTQTGSITTASDVPQCKTSSTSSHPKLDDGAPQSHVDANGATRYACVYSPADASASKQRPLLVFFHGSFGSADDVYDLTSLRAKAPTFDLSGDPNRPGYILLSINARNLHWPGSTNEDGAKHDTFHRDLASPSKNPDLANFDYWIDAAVATGKVDPKRIYTTGWSNGGRFAQMVAIARHATATPGGNKVAAAVVYSGTDPFNNTTASQAPSCQLNPYPKSNVGIGLIGRACDILPCDEAQATDLKGEGSVIEPGDVMSTWVSDLTTKVGATTQRLIIAGTGQTVSQCSGAALCNKAGALLNHVRWPDGIADNSGIDHEPAMLGFLRQHPLP